MIFMLGPPVVDKVKLAGREGGSYKKGDRLVTVCLLFLCHYYREDFMPF
jgi:hypothetical protein